MAHNIINFNELDVDKLFEDHTISEIIEIENLLDIEIERKRIELRGMVGDRYKDVLTAWDAIKSMKHVSEDIVRNIQNIIDKCEFLIAGTSDEDEPVLEVVTPQIIQERTIMIEIRLAITINSQIWIALEEENYSKAAQLYLLAQHIHIGLQLLNKEILDHLPILKRMKADIDALKHRILKRTKEKLQTVELSVEETSSNLNVLMLLEQYDDNTKLINIFIELRKGALNMVVNETHNSVRAQVTVMLKCLIATIHLLHECFISYQGDEKGLIWQELKNIVSESAPPTLSKVLLPPTPLVIYIPDLVKNYRPKWINENKTFVVSEVSAIIASWLKETSDTTKVGLKKSLELVTNIKGLHIIREEAFKIELPANWESMCANINLPKDFNVWFYFFQSLITDRAKELVLKKLSKSSLELYDSIKNILEQNLAPERSEKDLRWYIWKEEESDVSKQEDKHIGLSMKTKGYSSKILNLCRNLDRIYLELLEDLSLYVYGKEYKFLNDAVQPHNKNVDKNELEEYLKLECVNNGQKLTAFLETFFNSKEENDVYITKSLICARFLQALSELCPNFQRCCSCDGSVNEWEKIVHEFNESSLRFWKNWVTNCVSFGAVIAKELLNISPLDMLHVLPKWDNFEIQEQTDEKVFKSQIKLPSQPNLCLQRIFTEITNQLNAVIPHTLPKQIHLQFIEQHATVLLEQYETLSNESLNQTQALQFLFDVKYLTALCIARENLSLVTKSQNVCDKLRSQIDPFDLDVFYSYLQANVKMAVLQSQVILGCLLPSTGQLSSLGILEKNKEHENEPSALAISVPSTVSWFPLLPITAPIQKVSQATSAVHNTYKDVNARASDVNKKNNNSVTSVRSGAAAFFGAMTTDWFS